MNNQKNKTLSALTVIIIMLLVFSSIPKGMKAEASGNKLPKKGNTAAVPQEYKKKAAKRGTIQKVIYHSKDYTRNSAPIKKTAYVYLPYGYKQNDSKKKYNVLYLMHGWGDQAGKFFEHGTIRNMFDKMIAKKDIPPIIIVSPSFYNKNLSIIFPMVQKSMLNSRNGEFIICYQFST